jgi:uncharacterized membrane protein HdeD (DUF308 family)
LPADHLGGGAAFQHHVGDDRGADRWCSDRVGQRDPLAAARASWGWLHILMSVLFIGAAIWAFVRPYGAFWALATVVGLLLILRGSVDLFTSIDARDINPSWWLGVLVGIAEIIIGFWASQQAFPTRALLLIFWVGFFALFRGISDIVVAFEVRHAERT